MENLYFLPLTFGLVAGERNNPFRRGMSLLKCQISLYDPKKQVKR
jgi:hypothetical protein